jgi:ankyrin repeat protein
MIWIASSTLCKVHGHDPIIINTVDAINYFISDPAYGNTALSRAAVHGEAGIVRALLEAPSINVNSVDQSFQTNTPLLAVVISKHPDVVRALVTHPEINANVVGRFGQTALMLALAQCPDAVTAILSIRDIDVNFCGEVDRCTALHLLAKHSNKHLKEVPDHVKGFLAVPELKLDVLDKAGWTPLMHAAKAGNRALVDALLNAGADHGIANRSGCTAAKIAQYYGHERIEERIARQEDQDNSHYMNL